MRRREDGIVLRMMAKYPRRHQAYRTTAGCPTPIDAGTRRTSAQSVAVRPIRLDSESRHQYVANPASFVCERMCDSGIRDKHANPGFVTSVLPLTSESPSQRPPPSLFPLRIAPNPMQAEEWHRFFAPAWWPPSPERPNPLLCGSGPATRKGTPEDGCVPTHPPARQSL